MACSARTGDDTLASNDALSQSAGRPTSAHVTTDRGNQLSTSILVDPPTGAGWAAPAVIISYRDTNHVFGNAEALEGHVSVHLSAPDRHQSDDIQLRLDNTGAYQGPAFIELADSDHVEGVTVSVESDGKFDSSDSSHAHTYSLGAIRADASDLESVGKFDRVAVRGVKKSAKLVGHSLTLSVDIDDTTLTREEVPGYDGKGQAFVLVPLPNAPRPIWVRENTTGYPHASASATSFDENTVKREGVAFGIDTNMGTIWLQTPGDNAHP